MNRGVGEKKGDCGSCQDLRNTQLKVFKQMRDERLNILQNLNHLTHEGERLKGEVVNLKSENDDLKGGMATLEGENNDLKGKVATLEGKVATLEGKVEVLISESKEREKEFLRNDQEMIRRQIVMNVESDVIHNIAQSWNIPVGDFVFNSKGFEQEYSDFPNYQQAKQQIQKKLNEIVSPSRFYPTAKKMKMGGTTVAHPELSHLSVDYLLGLAQSAAEKAIIQYYLSKRE